MALNEVTDREAIISLWQEAFGDSREEIIFFLDNAKEYRCIGIYRGDTLASMLFLVKCNLGQYVYAACTAKPFRKQGSMAALLRSVTNQYPDVCLIPANDALVAYYQKQGFTQIAEVRKLVFSQSDAVKEYLYDGCTMEHPIVLMTEEQ